ncbi:hypothetical protein D3C87_1511040 [compost metagenome]
MVRIFDGKLTLSSLVAIDAELSRIAYPFGGNLRARRCIHGRGALARQLLHLTQIQARQRSGGMGGFQGRQLIQRSQAEIVQEMARGPEQRRTARRIAVPDHLDPPSIFQGFHDLRRHGHAAYVFNIAPGYGLTPSHNGQRLHDGA